MNVRAIAGWVLAVIAALLFAMAGIMKLIGNAMEVQTFVQFDLPMWFMYLVGVVEIAGVTLLLFTEQRLIGAGFLTVVGIGACVEMALHGQAAFCWFPLACAAAAIAGAKLLSS
jgi:uncharacterized membrane protein YphA (DoxX/SURF4 family)